MENTNSITFDQGNVRRNFERFSFRLRYFFVGAHGCCRAQVIMSLFGFQRYGGHDANARPSLSMRCRGDDRTLHVDRTWLSAFNEIIKIIITNVNSGQQKREVNNNRLLRLFSTKRNAPVTEHKSGLRPKSHYGRK